MGAWQEIAPRATPPDLIAFTAARRDVSRALSWARGQLDRFTDETAAIAAIPAPTFDEQRRAEHVARRMQALGAQDVMLFGSGNAIGRLGPAEGAGIALLAHSDTVFPPSLDHAVRRAQSRLYGPGVGDNAAGVAGTLLALRALVEANVALARPVWFVVDVGEEGLGNLRGARETVERLSGRVGAVLAVEGTMLGRLGHVAVGSRRLRARFSGGGGHSWLDFGRPSAVHAAVRAAAEISTLPVPSEPRTTYNIGRIEGGEGVNVLAASAEMLIDLRSTDSGALDDLSRRIETIVRTAARKSDGAIAVTIDEVGNRPAGALPRDHPLVDLCAATLRRLGLRPEPTAGSTDANVPLSQGIPALALGITRGGGTHSPDEWIELEPAVLGVQQLVLLIAALTARDG